MPLEEIDDEEWLYRTFPVPDTRQNGAIHYSIIDGVLRLGRGVWNDKTLKPSVDRKNLLSSANQVKFRETDVVIQIQAKEIRSISGMISNHNHDVVFDKKNDRPAHSLIITTPPFTHKPNAEKNKWREFQRLLSLAAAKHGWVIKPQDA